MGALKTSWLFQVFVSLPCSTLGTLLTKEIKNTKQLVNEDRRLWLHGLRHFVVTKVWNLLRDHQLKQLCATEKSTAAGHRRVLQIRKNLDAQGVGHPLAKVHFLVVGVVCGFLEICFAISIRTDKDRSNCWHQFASDGCSVKFDLCRYGLRSLPHLLVKLSTLFS